MIFGSNEAGWGHCVTRLRYVWWCLSLFIVLTGPAFVTVPALAQDSGSTPTLDQARTAYITGMELLKKEQWEQAAERFLYAAEARRTAGLLYHAAFCVEKLEHYKQALSLYQEAQVLAGQGAAPDVQALLPDALMRTEAALPRLTLLHLPAGSVVKVDGEVQTTAPLLRLDPGQHSVVVQAPRHQPFETQLDLFVGQRAELAVRLTPTPAPKPRPQPEHNVKATVRLKPPGKPYVVAAAAVLGAAGLGVGVYGTVEHARLTKRQDELGDFIDDESEQSPSACRDTASSWADACDELSDVTRQRKVAQALMIAGYSTFGVGVLAAVGTQLFWRGPAVEVAWVPGGGFLSVTRPF